MAVVNVNLDADTHRWLKEQAGKAGISQRELVRRLVMASQRGVVQVAQPLIKDTYKEEQQLSGESLELSELSKLVPDSNVSSGGWSPQDEEILELWAEAQGIGSPRKFPWDLRAIQGARKAGVSDSEIRWVVTHWNLENGLKQERSTRIVPLAQILSHYWLSRLLSMKPKNTEVKSRYVESPSGGWILIHPDGSQEHVANKESIQ